MHHDDGPRILGPQLVEAVRVQTLPLVFDALVGHAYAGKILGIEKLGPDCRAGRTVRVRFDGNVQALIEGLMDHRDGQRHIAEARAVQVTDVNVRASRGGERQHFAIGLRSTQGIDITFGADVAVGTLYCAANVCTASSSL